MSLLALGPKSTALHRIARKGNEQELLRLLRQGADVTARDAEGRTPLHLAVMRGHLGIIKGLLEHGGPAVLLSRDILNCTPVHLAAVQNQVQLISMLIAALLEDTSGCTPLHEVARRGCMQDFLGFLHLGWDIAACDGRNQEVLQLTEDASKTGTSAVQQILGWSPLHLAAMEGKVSSIEALIKKCNWDVHCQSANTWTPLHYAAAYNQVGSIEALVRMGAKVDIRDSVGSTPLHVACGEGHLPAVLKLIQLGGDPAAKDRDGCTPLYCASAWNRIEVVRKLHLLGCPSWVQSEEGRTAVHVAAEQGWVELIRVLVEELGCKVDSTDKYQFTPLHSAANWGWVDAISKLIELNHAVDVKDNIGQTPLHYAALHGRASAIQKLVQLGATLQEKDSRGGFTPLHLAADAGQCEAVSKLIELGAKTETKTSKGMTCLQLATRKGPGNADVIGLLVELGANLNYKTDDRNVETPLHIAARSGRKDVILKLIKHGADVSAKTKDGSTPLHYAAAFGQAHVIEILIKAGCSVHSRDNPKNTPLHLAAGCGFLDAVVKLVELGADLDARDMSECTPLQNTAHGTYSALAHVPQEVSNSSTGQFQGLGSLSLRRSGLSSAISPKGSGGSSGVEDPSGMVPVRTGFAWATFGNNESLNSMYLNDLESSSLSGASRLYSSWKGAELMSLLRKATRGMRPGSLFISPDSLLDNPASVTAHHHHHGDRYGHLEDAEDWDKWTHRDIERDRESLELLLKKTEALQMSHMEQDRSRLIPVAEKLVELGADIKARDNEGRTALHLAAGCGDKLMVLKLVDLGSDINSRDSVGGNAMHHAAMANKKEMMFTLALLGCDWRAKADGIDGASPAFVLCGQHGKTTRQQKLLEAKLKRVYMAGEAARRAEKGSFEDAWERTRQEEEEDYEEKLEKADANMAALLQELADEEQAAAAAASRKCSNRKKNKKQTNEKPSCTPSSNPKTLAVGAKVQTVEKRREVETGGEKEDGEREEEGSGDDGGGNKAAIREALDEAVNCAIFVLEIGEVAGKEAMLDVKEKIDSAIQHALQNKVGTKYAKKVRKKLLYLLEKHPETSPKSRESVGKGWGRSGVEESEQGWVKAPCTRNKNSNRRNSSAGCNGWQQVNQAKKTQNQRKEQKSFSFSSKTSSVGRSSRSFSNGTAASSSSCCFGNEDSPKGQPTSGRKSNEKGVYTALTKTMSMDSGQNRNLNKGVVWDQTQKSSTGPTTGPLLDPDFPPLAAANIHSSSSTTTSVSMKIVHKKRETVEESLNHGLLSEESGEGQGNKTDVESSPLTLQSISSTCSSTSAGKIEAQSSVETYPQYELFGSSGTPALPTKQFLPDSPLNGVNSLSSGLQTTEQDSSLYALQSGEESSLPVMGMMSGGHQYPTMNGNANYTSLMMPTLYHPMSYDAMNPYTQTNLYPTPPPHQMLTYGVPNLHFPSPPSLHGPLTPPPPPPLPQDPEEIANKLPKEIPGLVESEREEDELEEEREMVRRKERVSPRNPNNVLMDNQSLTYRLLLGELASELEA